VGLQAYNNTIGAELLNRVTYYSWGRVTLFSSAAMMRPKLK